MMVWVVILLLVNAFLLICVLSALNDLGQRIASIGQPNSLSRGGHTHEEWRQRQERLMSHKGGG